MKLNLSSAVFIFLLMLVACQKEIDWGIRAVESTPTIYRFLGPYDDYGKPNYLLPKDSISSGLLSFVDSTLLQDKDLRTTNPQLVNNPVVADIIITRQSDVFVTFVAEQTSYTNALAFYTYPTGQPPVNPKDIHTITYIFPNAGYLTTLQPGDKVKIGRFNAGTSIGFVLLNGWNATTKTIDKNAVHFYSTDALNPEVDPNLKKHAIFINYTPENKILIAFENVDRSSPDCNHDFNDLVFYATVTP